MADSTLASISITDNLTVNCLKATNGNVYIRFENDYEGKYPMFLSEWDVFIEKSTLLNDVLFDDQFREEEKQIEYQLSESRYLGARSLGDHFEVYFRDDGNFSKKFILPAEDWSVLITKGIDEIKTTLATLVKGKRKRRREHFESTKRTLYVFQITDAKGNDLYKDDIYYFKKQLCAGAAVLRSKMFGADARFHIRSYKIVGKAPAVIAADILYWYQHLTGNDLNCDELTSLLHELYNLVFKFHPVCHTCSCISECLLLWGKDRTNHPPQARDAEDDYVLFVKDWIDRKSTGLKKVSLPKPKPKKEKKVAAQK